MTVNKPHWLSRDDFAELLRRHGGVPRCAVTGETEGLHVDHIVPRDQGGGDDVSNLQFLVGYLNCKKGARPDEYWSRTFYWDQTPCFENLRGAQRAMWEAIVEHHDWWFSRPLSEIARALYVNAWLVGAGKTIGIAIAASAFNHVQREQWGAPRRGDCLLLLTKEQATRDQLAEDLRADLVDFGIFNRAPRVGIIEGSWQFEQDAWLDEHDLVVSCVQQFWKKDGQRLSNIQQILAKFGVIGIDEPHFAAEQARDLVDLATGSVCFGFTGSPITNAGVLLPKMVRLSIYGYQQAAEIDHSVKYVNREETQFRAFVHEIGVDEAELLVQGRDVVDPDTRRAGYDRNVEPQKQVVRRVVRDMLERDHQEGLEGQLAPHRLDIGDVRPVLHYSVHSLIVVDAVDIAKMLVDDLNAFFDRDRVQFPEEHGWHAKVVHTQTERHDAKPLKPQHPWFRAYKEGKIDNKCARILFVIGMGREGINNPWCGIVGVACSISSVVEAVQRALGRQMRAYIQMREKTLFVPDRSLDTVHVVTHEAFGNTPALQRGIDFVCDMEGHLESLQSVEDLAKDGLIEAPLVDEEAILPIRDKIDIACFVGRQHIDGEDVSRQEIIDRFAPEGGRRAERVGSWFDTLESDPREAYRAVRFDRRLPRMPIVKREYLSNNPTDAELEAFAKTNGQAHQLPLTDPVRDVLRAWYKRESERFHLPPLRSPYKDLEAIRKSLQAKIFGHIGDHLTSDGRDRVPLLAAIAVKTVLDVPSGERARNSSKWDTPQAHAILMRPEIRVDITHWATAQLVKEGFCPTLSAVFDQARQNATTSV